MRTGWGRTLAAGLAGGIAMNGVMLLTFRLLGFGWSGGGILLDRSIQSPKLIAVWTEIKPIPLVVSRPAPIIVGLMLFAMGHAVVYRWLSPGWPRSTPGRALRFAGLLFFFTFLFWEFFTPYNMFGEPLHLIGLELIFWAAIALGEAAAITCVMEWGTGTKESTAEKGAPAGA